MSRPALFVAALAVLGLSSRASWAMPQSAACRAASPTHRVLVPDGPMCLLVQDPWQDCAEDPWQLSAAIRPDDTFSDPWQDDIDPWQDDVDPWQPVFVTSRAPATADSNIDPWQPVVSHLAPLPAASVRDATEDPWQPSVVDPWQDDSDDPWQLP